METFGTRLRRLREDRSLKQRELAQRAEMDSAQVSRYERGVIREPSSDVLARLARALDCPVSELRGDRVPYEGNDRRHPELQPLRDAIARLEPLGTTALAAFAARAAQLAERFAKRRS